MRCRGFKRKLTQVQSELLWRKADGSMWRFMTPRVVDKGAVSQEEPNVREVERASA
jgi:hypothetical protein